MRSGVTHVSMLGQVRTGDIAGYMLMPRIVPRVREFFASGFGWIAFMMAYVFAGVRLLPGNHPYLQHANFGRFGIRHVIAEAANRLEVRRDNLDQIVVFVALLTGFVLLFLQFAVLIVSFFVHPALAADKSFTSFFKTDNPNDDIAYELLDKVFAIPGMFGSKYDPAGGGIGGLAGNGIPGFNQGLQKLLKFYNTAMLIVGVAIFLYYIIAVVAETANTGTPFGRRFSHIYAPLRLVIAVGLLVPLNYGFNSAQYITLFAAKFGSSLATNTWLLFNSTIKDKGGSNPLAAPGETLVGRPQAPDVSGLVSAMVMIKTCANGYKIDFTAPPYAQSDTATTENIDVEPYLVWGGSQQAPMLSTEYGTAAGTTMFNGRDIVVRFGHQSQTLFPGQQGYVYPYCGEITIPATVAQGDATDNSQAGAIAMQTKYYQLVKDLWNDTDVNQFANDFTAIYLIKDPNHSRDAAEPSESLRNQLLRKEDAGIQTAVNDARDTMVGNDDTFSFTDDLKARGWGGAAIWYNRLAMWNGAYFGAVFNVPHVTQMPDIMKKVENERDINNQNASADDRYNPQMNNNQVVNIPPGEQAIAGLMNAVYKYFEVDTPGARTSARPDGGVLVTVINHIFPYNALMDVRYNVDIHPLAQLVGLGKSIIDMSLGNLAIGLLGTAGAGFMKGMEMQGGQMVGFLSGAWISLTTIALTIGFTLYYVLPFMPFIYFFFAVGGWVKSIFEAMVGVPLWALAHLRIDGDGLPGERAIEGYFLIFEIFLRPVLILFGLLGGLLIFTALARTLHDIFGLLVSNVGGFDQAALTNDGIARSDSVAVSQLAQATAATTATRGSPLDEFFYTIVYTIILYSMALSSFKLIDQLPATIMRWLGSGAQSFASSNSEPAEGFLAKFALADQIINQNLIGGLSSGAENAGLSAGSLFNRHSVTVAAGSKKTP